MALQSRIAREADLPWVDPAGLASGFWLSSAGKLWGQFYDYPNRLDVHRYAYCALRQDPERITPMEIQRRFIIVN
jgi:hypothetical protein